MNSFLDLFTTDASDRNKTEQRPVMVAPKKKVADKTDKKIESSESIQRQLHDLIEITDNYKSACSDALDTLYPLIDRVIELLSASEREANKKFTREWDNALNKLELVKALVESTAPFKASSEKKVAEPKSESITDVKVKLLTDLHCLREIIEGRLVISEINSKEKLSLALDDHKAYFNDTIRTLQEPLRKMKHYLKLLKQSIDYLKTHPIPEKSMSDISQYLIFLEEDLIGKINHEIDCCTIEGLVGCRNIEVEHRIHSILEKLSEWEAKYDEYSSILVEIEFLSRKIEWKIHLFQFLKTLKLEIDGRSKVIKDLESAIQLQVKLLKKDRETSFDGAKAEVDNFLTSYEQRIRPAIEDVNKQVILEIEILKEFNKLNLPEACEEIFAGTHFYSDKVREAHKEKVAASFEQSRKEITATLNEIQVKWDEEFKPLNESVVGQLEVLASSVLTKKGEIRGGVWFAIKETTGLNTKRVTLPNYSVTPVPAEVKEEKK